MPSYPIEPDKLLAAAKRLCPDNPGRGRPSYTAHRRAVSTAYYAVFHAITERVAAAAFPSGATTVHRRVRRWVGHGDVRTVCVWVGQVQGTVPGAPPRPIAALRDPQGEWPFVDVVTARIADAFLELNDKRELADYDHDAIFTRADTRAHLALANSIVPTINNADSEAVRCFFGLIAMQARITGR